MTLAHFYRNQMEGNWQHKRLRKWECLMKGTKIKWRYMKGFNKRRDLLRANKWIDWKFKIMENGTLSQMILIKKLTN